MYILKEVEKWNLLMITGMQDYMRTSLDSMQSTAYYCGRTDFWGRMKTMLELSEERIFGTHRQSFVCRICESQKNVFEFQYRVG